MNIKEIVDKIPLNPGIYMMKDKDGKIIYVGKAKALRKRVRQYFNKSNKSLRIEKMVSQIADIEYIVTENELEALVLECNYIKENRPKYNVMLKDDKTYPYIKITVADNYPSIYITRTMLNDGSKYFGPYTDVNALRETMITLREIFPIKRCKYNFNKKSNAKIGPCLYYHIGRCLGPCINEINRESYRQMIHQIVLFLGGKTIEVEKHIKDEIEKCVEKLEFEKAAVLKLRLEKISKVTDRQKVSNINENNTDIWGYVYLDSNLHIQIFKIRESKVLKHENLNIEGIEKSEVSKIIPDVISQYYTENTSSVPRKVYFKYDDKFEYEVGVLQEYLSNICLYKVEIVSPKKGSKLKLIEMIENNIKVNLTENRQNPLEELKNILKMQTQIETIEAYDISNLKNDHIVGSMIVYENGAFNKSKYRKFKIYSTGTQNDVMSMKEVITRRLKHIDEWPLPDLICIDGGLGQVRAAKEVLLSEKLDVNVIGMVKDDKHRTRGIINIEEKEIDFRNKKEFARVFALITKIQDEVHRFTITYHRKLRDNID